MENKIKLFENKVVRSHWDAEQEEWYFSVVDVCWILADSIDFTTARKYWNKLKQLLKAEGSQLVTDCPQLKLMVNRCIKHSRHSSPYPINSFSKSRTF